MSGKPKIAPELWPAIIDEHEAGADISDLCKALSVSAAAIHLIFAKCGVVWRRKKGGHPQTSLEIEQQVAARYRAGEGSTTIGKCYGVCKATVWNILDRHGVGIRPRGALRSHPTYERKPRIKERDLHIRQLNEAGKTVREIADELRADVSGIYYSLRKQGVLKLEGEDWAGETHARKPRLKPIKIQTPTTLRENAFDVLTPEAEYWIGYLLADGCIHKSLIRPSSRLTFRLARKDRIAVERFKGWLGAETQIVDGELKEDGLFKHRYYSALQVTSNRLCDQLAKYNIVPNKTLTAEAPIALQDSTHFWRGLMDGDGCVYERNEGTGYQSGTLRIVEQFADFCAGVDPDCSIIPRHHMSHCAKVGCWVADLRTKETASKVFKALYNTAEWALPRKKASALSHFT